MTNTQGRFLKIREAEMVDFKSIERISLGLGYEKTSSQAALERLLTVLDSKQDRLWVAEIDNEIVGWLHAFHTLRVASRGLIEIGGIVISTNNRNQGIGQALITVAQDWSAECGLVLRARCNSRRHETHAFYKAVDFIKTKEQYVFDSKSK